jgi:hypothetical protein
VTGSPTRRGAGPSSQADALEEERILAALMLQSRLSFPSVCRLALPKTSLARVEAALQRLKKQGRIRDRVDIGRPREWERVTDVPPVPPSPSPAA